MADTVWLDQRQLDAWRAFLLVSSLIERQVEQQLRDDAQLSHQQYEVLSRLADAPDGELRMTVLADVALTSKSGLTYQVTQLEKAGLVRRRSSAGDDRGVVASLTDAGLERVRATAPGHAGLVRTLFVDGLSDDEFDGLTRGLGALVDWLTN
ncbi:MarR family winged helix-turn-helix transcriptional regulator [Streptomyces hyaluromycini]|uniref:MarR family winged helix-turn-helix transcriptional regulator n=1 Tax=Streptomyces hyaluromycini TaxID=1377993 RepID=UPI000B5CD4C7|nr:MarR family transcriptional regulator [Streptomyces hyaluromycini]